MRVWMRRVGCLMMSRKLPAAAAALGLVRIIWRRKWFHNFAFFLQYMPKSISESANKLFCWKIMSFGERWPAPARRAFHSSCWLRTAPSWHRPYGPWLGQRFNWAGWLLFWPYNFHLTSYILRGSIEIFHSQFSINQSINQLINQSIILLCNEPPRRLWQPVEENCTNSHHCRDDLSWVYKADKSTKYYRGDLMKGKHFEISFEEMSGGTMVLFHEEVKLNLKVNVPVPENPGKTSDDETTDGPGIVHAHTKIDLPFSWEGENIIIKFTFHLKAHRRRSPWSRRRRRCSRRWPWCRWSTRWRRSPSRRAWRRWSLRTHTS